MLFEIINQRVIEIREFIELPWEQKKKRLLELWEKYGRLYLLLFVAAGIVAFINVYWSWLQSQPYKFKQIGGDPASPSNTPVNVSANKPAAGPIAEKTEAGPIAEKPAAGASAAAVAGISATNEKSTSNNKTKSDFEKLTSNNPKGPNNLASASTSNKEKNKPSNVINQQVSHVDQVKNKATFKEDIKARKAARKASQPKQSLSDTFGQMSGNIGSAINGGMGKALSVIGAFFMFILGLIMFCSAPVVLFYMWMKKLITPMFPTKMAPAPDSTNS